MRREPRVAGGKPGRGRVAAGRLVGLHGSPRIGSVGGRRRALRRSEGVGGKFPESWGNVRVKSSEKDDVGKHFWSAAKCGYGFSSFNMSRLDRLDAIAGQVLQMISF